MKKTKDILIVNPSVLPYEKKLKLLPRLKKELLSWQKVHGRNNLPWKSQDPYYVWISEVMLQQTQVSTGMIRFGQWMARFPTIEDLAKASSDEVMEAWEGLGYYARARNLHQAAKHVWQQYQGVFPMERQDRLSLSGVGPSTASAIGAFAFGKKEAIYDGNVARVWSRWWGDEVPSLEKESEKAKFWWGWAQLATPDEPHEVRSWTQGMMDLGATVCTPKNPKCDVCPWQDTCRAHALGKETSWPIKVKKTKVEKMSFHWLWLVEDQKVAVFQRPEKGIWGKLWSFPENEDARTQAVLAEGNHALSHRQIHWRIERAEAQTVEIPENIQWVDRERFQSMALPRPIRVWWESLSSVEKNNLFRSH